MNRRRRTLPPVPPKAPSELRPLIAAMTEILETGEGVRGDPLDRKLTLRDILDSGIGTLKPGMRPGQDGNLDSGVLPPAPDLSIPPAPAGFDAQGGFYGMINLSWTIPGQQYRNHAYTNVFRSEEDNFANAEVIGREAGGFYTDYVRDDAVDPDDPTKLKGYYYWITFTSVADIEGPPNSPYGTYAAPLADLGYVIELLTGEIDASVLAQSLKEEIEKIPAIESSIERIDPIEEELRGPESLDGTVANRLAKEREQRIEALDDERKERIEGLTFEAQARAQAIQDETQNRTTAIHQAVEQLELEDSLLALQQDVIAAAYDANAASIYSMAQIRINDSEVFASQIEQLFGNVSNNESLILNEQQIRIDQFSSLATQVGILSARLDARPSLASSFEPGSDYDAWTATSDSSVAPEISDVYAGLQAALITSSLPNADPQIDGVRRLISKDTSSQFSGNEIRFSLYAKRPSANASTEFAVAYCVDGVNGEWTRFSTTNEYTFYDVVINVPADTESVDHELVIWGDTSGSGKGVLVDRVLATLSETDIPEVAAAIEQMQKALAEQEQAVANQLQGFLSQLNENTSSIERETETRSTQYDALARDIETMTALTEQNVADIAAEREAWSSAVEAVARDVLDMSARVDDAEGRITRESNIRVTEDDLLAAVQRVISASRGAASATFYSLEEVRISDSQSSALRIDGLEVGLADARTAIEQAQELLAEEDRALAKQIETVSAALGDELSNVQQTFESEVSRLNGALNTNARAILDVQSASEEALVGAKQGFDTEIRRVDGRIDAAARSVTEVRTDLGKDVAGVQQTLNTEVSRLDGRIDSTSRSITTVQSQLGSELSTVQQSLETNVTRIDKALASNATSIQTVQSSLGKDVASVRSSMDTQVERIDGELVEIGARYTAQVQVNGLIGGFGIHNDGTEVEAGFDVERFWVGRTDSDKRKPFIIDDDMVYMNNAMIRNGSIQEGQLGPITIGKFFLNDGTPVTTAGGLIRAEAIDVDNLSVAEAATFTGIAQSANWPSSGWRLHPNGSFGLKSSASGGRLEMIGDRQDVYDQSSRLRVRIGRL
ncbi:phage tail tip fiber protein [Vreelandella zhanjiangensis]|uniref:phage tail tip fiber protein n=1 Tax=Vreelandella zhanjiangensis TaxID=1121960 RepID=UPI00402A6900